MEIWVQEQVVLVAVTAAVTAVVTAAVVTVAAAVADSIDIASRRVLMRYLTLFNIGLLFFSSLYRKKLSFYLFSSSPIHSSTWASLGMRQSARGLRLTVPTLGPSGMQERLNCWEKKRLRKTPSHRRIVPSS